MTGCAFASFSALARCSEEEGIVSHFIGEKGDTMHQLDLSRRNLLLGSAASLGVLMQPGIARAAAPFLGETRYTHHRFRLGDFETTTLMDSDAFVESVYPIFGKNASEQMVQNLMRDNLLPTNRYQPGFSPMLVNTGKELILFDTGNGDDGFIPRPKGGWLKAQLKAAGYHADDVDVVVLSHGHPDHIGGLKEGKDVVFKNARYVVSQIDHEFWYNSDNLREGLRPFGRTYKQNVDGLLERFQFIKPGDEVAHGIDALEAYGHTPGHLAFHIESGGKRLLFWGDCAHHQVVSLACPNWHCVFDVDQVQAAKTRSTIFDFAATEKVAVVGYHMPFPSLGYVERLTPDGYRWLAHSFQLKT